MDLTPAEVEKLIKLLEKIKTKLIKATGIILKIGNQYPHVLRECANDEELQDLINDD